MPFSTDRDLLVLEPALFRDVAWSAQTRLTSSSVLVTGTTLTGATSNFVAAKIAPGMVALVNDAPLEILGVDSETTLTVSRLRDDEDAEAIPPLPVSGASLRIATFGPQREIVCRQLLAALGLDPAPADGAFAPGPTAADVLNTRDVALVEALGALHLILSSAAAMVGETSTLWTKAAHYRDRFDRARGRLSVLLDLNHDGVGDATRRVAVTHLTRA